MSVIKRFPVLRERAFWLPAVLVLILLTLLLAFASRSLKSSLSSSAADESDTTQGSGGASVVAVRRGQISRALLLDGELRAVSSRTVFASTSEEAKITYLPPEGSTVKAGDRLVELDSGTILGKIKDAEEKIVAAENEIVKTRSTQEAALRELDVDLSRRWLAYEQAKVKARAPAQLVPRRDYQDNQLTLEKARTEYETQQLKIEQKKKENAAEVQVKVIQLEKLKANLQRATSNLDGMNIKAPADGMVIYSEHWYERRKIQIGEVVWGGFPIVRLPDLKAMEAVAQVNEVDGPRLSPGQRATIKLDAYPGVEIAGAVKEIAETAVKASWMSKAKVFRVVVSLNRTVTEIMKPGMSAQIAVSIADHEAQLVVPRSSVAFESGTPLVARLESDNKTRDVAVTIVASDALLYAVADNGALKEGDRIVARRN
ncbi:MAG TPA: efflux RND transporter periplasmic adaptor subunit [Blastocatellia bacterium]|nr:efflux RND transporter periplasmic adaptor subunit [Blastocatellia bacterium]